jgi:hypothetical protein
MDFNDRCASFADLHAVIVKAKALAQRDAERLQPPEAAKPKRQTAAENKRQLLAEIERERMAARWITSETYILCPGDPEPSQPQRLAA